MTPTLVDIARETKTSVSTVSRVLAGGDVALRISAETRTRVIDAANRMGYRPNLLARSLRTRKSYSVALLLPDISCGNYAHIARRIESGLHQQGYSLMLCNSGDDLSLEREYLEILPRKGLDGIVVVPHEHSDDSLAKLSGSSVATVVLNHKIANLPCVYSDLAAGATQLAEALEQADIKRILLITGEQTIERHRVRTEIFASRFEIADQIVFDQHGENDKAAESDTDGDYDAVVCTGPHIAERHLMARRKVDNGKLLACFDASNPLMALPFPVMSCDSSTEMLADGVLQLLLPQLRGGVLEQPHVVVPSTIKTNHAMAVR